ncbi:MAG: hypothetical protein RIF41_29830, partial [Polyangiaceae bacterium]
PTYWGATGGVGVTVTESQRRIVRASPSYRALRTGDAPSMPDAAKGPEAPERRHPQGRRDSAGAMPLRCGHVFSVPQ